MAARRGAMSSHPLVRGLIDFLKIPRRHTPLMQVRAPRLLLPLLPLLLLHCRHCWHCWHCWHWQPSPWPALALPPLVLLLAPPALA